MLLPVLPLTVLSFIDCSAPYTGVFLLTLGYSFKYLIFIRFYIPEKPRILSRVQNLG